MECVSESRLTSQIEEVIDVIRPAIQADAGDIELISVNAESGEVKVTLLGACTSCPLSSGTIHSGVERILRDRVDPNLYVTAI